MTYAEIAVKLTAVSKELDKIELKGRNNMAILMSCQHFLDTIASELNKEDRGDDSTELSEGTNGAASD